MFKLINVNVWQITMNLILTFMQSGKVFCGLTSAHFKLFVEIMDALSSGPKRKRTSCSRCLFKNMLACMHVTVLFHLAFILPCLRPIIQCVLYVLNTEKAPATDTTPFNTVRCLIVKIQSYKCNNSPNQTAQQH